MLLIKVVWIVFLVGIKCKDAVFCKMCRLVICELSGTEPTMALGYNGGMKDMLYVQWEHLLCCGGSCLVATLCSKIVN